MKQLKPGFNAIIMALLLAGCAAPAPVMPQTLVVTKTIYQPFVWPAYLKTCQADPVALPIPHIAATDPKAGSQVATARYSGRTGAASGRRKD